MMMFEIGDEVTVAKSDCGKIVGRTYDDPARMTYDVELRDGSIMANLSARLLARKIQLSNGDA